MKVDLKIPDNDKCWFWSDTHFGHDNIIKFCDRPFKDTDEMYSKMLVNYNTLVQPDDIVFWGGDLSLGLQWSKLNDMLKCFNGTKYLILGNHDSKNLIDSYLTIFEKVFVRANLLAQGGRLIIVDHYPLQSWEGFMRHSIQIHGHTHSKSNFSKTVVFSKDKEDFDRPEAGQPTIKTAHNRFNICVEALNYKPITLKEIIKLCNEEKAKQK